MKECGMLAFDLGASNGRAVYGIWKDGRLKSQEIYRFLNEPVRVNGKLYWDILRLFHEIKKGMAICRETGLEIASLGVNSWGNTVGMFDSQGDLLVNPYHYRDDSAKRTAEEFYGRYSRERLFSGTLYQPMAMQPAVFLNYLRKEKPQLLDMADKVLMISDVFNYFLCGVKASEKTMAATSALVDMRTGAWNRSLMEEIGIREGLFPELVENGTVLGDLQEDICRELGIANRPKVIAVAGHDTAAASGCIEGEKEDSLYLSCGTWSCMGCTVESPVEHREFLELGLTNDLGLYGVKQFRFNHTGLWILQESRRSWEKEGIYLSWQKMNEEMEQAEPFLAMIDTEAEDFFEPGDMPGKVQAFCRRTDQRVPQTRGEICRVVLESLVYRYRYSADCLQAFSGIPFRKMTVMGGGSKNRLLCQWTANVLNRQVTAGIQEASVTGNLLQQAAALGCIRDFRQGLKNVESEHPKMEYIPQNQQEWEKQYQEYRKRFGIKLPGKGEAL